MNNLALNAEMYNTIIGIQSMDDTCIEKGRIIFEEYKGKNIISNSSFYDIHWQFSDEYSNVGMQFNFNEISYNKYYKDVFYLSFSNFVDYVKTYVMFNMGKFVLATLRDTLNDIKRIISCTLEDLNSSQLFIGYPNRILDFLSMLPVGDTKNSKMEKFMEQIDVIAEIQNSEFSTRQRFLASFDSYFLFNDILNDYWNLDLDHDTRLFYYPLFLWWQVTAVIPLRPREFILTPRNCLEEKEDGTYLTLRRNKLKGSSRTVSYQIDKDYEKVQYKIPEKLALQIRQYINFTSYFAPTELETLFVSDTHYKHWGQRKHSNSRYFTYVNLHCVLRYFFNDVIEGYYKLKIIYDRTASHLNEGEINYLYLGDTRHIALINIIAEGGTPVIAMSLAGHENIEMSAHYYSNITQLIECRTYKQYRRVLKGNISYNLSPQISLPDTVKSCVPLENGGRCYSKAFVEDDFSDCIKAVGKNGEIGYCPECPFYSSNDKRFYDDDKYKRNIEDDCKFLKEIIGQVRLGITDKEDIMQALKRLQSSSLTYQKYFDQKAKYLESKGEKLWGERQK